MSSKDRVALHRKRLSQKGGKQIAVHLPPDTAQRLDLLVRVHGNVTAAVIFAIDEAPVFDTPD